MSQSLKNEMQEQLRHYLTGEISPRDFGLWMIDFDADLDSDVEATIQATMDTMTMAWWRYLDHLMTEDELREILNALMQQPNTSAA